LTSWFPGMLLMYFLNDFEMVPVAPIITGVTFVFTFYSGLYISKSYLFPFYHLSISWGCNVHIIIIIIITTIINYLLYAGYLDLYAWKTVSL
jgi:hypothetical protein